MKLHLRSKEPKGLKGNRTWDRVPTAPRMTSGPFCKMRSLEQGRGVLNVLLKALGSRRHAPGLPWVGTGHPPLPGTPRYPGLPRNRCRKRVSVAVTAAEQGIMAASCFSASAVSQPTFMKHTSGYVWTIQTGRALEEHLGQRRRQPESLPRVSKCHG